MEQHGNELDDNNGKEEEHEDNSNWLQMQILFGHNNLGNGKILLLELNSCMQFLLILIHCVISAVDL